MRAEQAMRKAGTLCLGLWLWVFVCLRATACSQDGLSNPGTHAGDLSDLPHFVAADGLETESVPVDLSADDDRDVETSSGDPDRCAETCADAGADVSSDLGLPDGSEGPDNRDADVAAPELTIGEVADSADGGCIPECDGLECGPDGCGAMCASCQAGAVCLDGLCIPDPGGCDAIPVLGRCADDRTLIWCEDEILHARRCEASEICHWNSDLAEFGCVVPIPLSTPCLLAIEPGQGEVTGGTPFSIEGCDLRGGLSIFFGNQAASSVVWNSATQAQGVTPAGPVGPVDVTVINPDQNRAVLPGGFEYFRPPEMPVLNWLEPDFGKTAGNTQVTLHGFNLAGVTEVLFDALPAAVQSLSNETAVVLAPPHTPGAVAVRVNIDATHFAELPDAFLYAEAGVPIVDGQISDDWSPLQRVAQNLSPSNWSSMNPPPDNVINTLQALYVTRQGDDLVIAIEGQVQDQNAIVLYIDADYDPLAVVATGWNDKSDCSDNDKPVDSALCGSEASADATPLHVGDPRFGADVAFAVVGMAAYPAPNYPDCPDLANSSTAGWRRLTPPANFDWLCSQVRTTSDAQYGHGVVETRVALADLYPGGMPEHPAPLALFVRLVNHLGTYSSNQGLPQVQPAPPDDAGTVNDLVFYSWD